MSSVPPSSAPSGATTNLALVEGVLSSAPRVRDLPSGDQIWHPEGTKASVPVQTRPGAPPPLLAAGDLVLVTGSVRRRYFRAGGTSASRTDVVADTIIVGARRSRGAARKRAARRLLD